jgi:hypothetical protein
MLQQSQAFADRLRREAGNDLTAQLERAWQRTYNRSATSAELAEATAFARAEGVPALCRALLNSNEFLFIP